MKPRSRLPILIALLALMLALLGPAAASAAERTVSVTATATLKVPNDSASLGFSVSRERRSRGAALSAVAGGLHGVIGAVQGIPGVGAGDVTTGRISVRKSLRGERTVYRAAEGIGVTLHQPDKAGELVSAAIGAGATGVSGPNFFVGDTEAAFADALAAAFAKAKSKATTLASAAGASLGAALEIDEGEGAEFVPSGEKTAPTSGGCATAGPTPQQADSKRCTTTPPPTKPGASTVTATVHAIFALQ
ncbi:MAG TPA: SIMPL domain-containing protein [Solirubrobacterales bacterium]|nr:SIMPL domain-containing protein [Solirubrobacterales bacterium]